MNFATDFRKILRGFHEIRPVGAELFQEIKRTDEHDEASSRFSQFCSCTWKEKKRKERNRSIHGYNSAVSCNYVRCL